MHANQAKSLDFYQARFLSFDAHQTVSNIQPKPTSRFLYTGRAQQIYKWSVDCLSYMTEENLDGQTNMGVCLSLKLAHGKCYSCHLQVHFNLSNTLCALECGLRAWLVVINVSLNYPTIIWHQII